MSAETETIPIVAETAVVAALVRRLDNLATAHNGAMLAVTMPGWALDPIHRTEYILSGDANRVAALLRLIEANGTPTAFLFVKTEGHQAEVCCDPLPWTAAADSEMEDYLATVTHHFAAVLVAGGKAAMGKVN